MSVMEGEKKIEVGRDGIPPKFKKTQNKQASKQTKPTKEFSTCSSTLKKK